VHTAQKYGETHDASLIWEGHKAGRDIGYCHLEKLHNLEAPAAHGFGSSISCFPHKIRGRLGRLDAGGGDLRRQALKVGDYTDFYTSSTTPPTVGKLFRPDDPLLPNYQWVPIGYHGRVQRGGQRHSLPPPQRGRPSRRADEAVPFGPCARLDYELELGCTSARATRWASRCPRPRRGALSSAWACSTTGRRATSSPGKYQPLGPFLAKNFATTVSPWIVTMEALAPFRVPLQRPLPPAAAALSDDADNMPSGGSTSSSSAIGDRRSTARRVCRPPRSHAPAFKHQYWTPAQMVTHTRVGGCNLQSPATCWAPAPSRAPRRRKPARWSS
jgi:fumarylacetoacetase